MWEVCEHANFRGRCQVFSGNESNLRDRNWSDIISSLRRVSGGGGVRPPRPPYPPQPPAGSGLEVFSDRDYRGERRMLSGAVTDFQDLDFNDRAESLRVPRGQSWEVCVDNFFRNCRIVNGDVRDLGSLGLRSRISSARPYFQGGGGGYPPPGAVGRLVLYDDREYRGRSFTVTNALSTLPGFAGRGESAVVNGGHWQICDGARFSGRCATLSASVPDVRRLGLRGGVVSARPIARPQY